MIFVMIDENGKVTHEHHKPFDEVYGMKKTKEELETMGMLVDSLPVPEVVEGKQSILMYNKTDGLFYYDYVTFEKQLTPDEEIAIIKEQMIVQQAAINALLGV